MELPIATVEPTPDTQPKPEAAGKWSLGNLSGTVAGVCKAIDDSDAPAHWKAAIKTDLLQRCGTDFNFVYLDAHMNIEKGNSVLHYHAVPDKKLL